MLVSVGVGVTAGFWPGKAGVGVGAAPDTVGFGVGAPGNVPLCQAFEPATGVTLGFGVGFGVAAGVTVGFGVAFGVGATGATGAGLAVTLVAGFLTAIMPSPS